LDVGSLPLDLLESKLIVGLKNRNRTAKRHLYIRAEFKRNQYLVLRSEPLDEHSTRIL
jgi:hypothetical protein